MKLNPRTIQILKNFSTINPSLLFKPGSYLHTIAPERNIMAKAAVKESFPSQFAIYDVSRFLSVLSLSEDADLDIKDKHVIIGKGRGSLRYKFAAPEMVVAPPDKEIAMANPEVKFSLTSDDMNNLLRAAAVMQTPNVIIHSQKGKIIVTATDAGDKDTVNSDCFSLEVGTTDKDFVANFKTSNLRVLPGEYEVELVSRGIGHFYNDELHYWISVEQDSRFN